LQARDPKEEKIRMKGVKLQYTGEARVFFRDVAGIRDAEVRALRETLNPKPSARA
jgi:hypothetical protein